MRITPIQNTYENNYSKKEAGSLKNDITFGEGGTYRKSLFRKLKERLNIYTILEFSNLNGTKTIEKHYLGGRFTRITYPWPIKN